MELEILRPWLSIIAIKDILWEQAKGDWAFKVIPAGSGIVRWNDAASWNANNPIANDKVVALIVLDFFCVCQSYISTYSAILI